MSDRLELARVLTTPIGTRAQAQNFIEVLHQNGKLFHFDDDTRDLWDRDGNPTFTPDQAALADRRRCELYGFDWGEFECPIGYALHISREDDE